MMPIATNYHWQKGIIRFRDNFFQVSRNSYLFFVCLFLFPLKMYYKFSLHVLAAAAKSLQSCPTLCDPIDGSPPGSSVHEIPQARVYNGEKTVSSTIADGKTGQLYVKE